MKRLKNIYTVDGGYIEIPYQPSLKTKVEIKFRILTDDNVLAGVFGVFNSHFGIRVSDSGVFEVLIGHNGAKASVNFSKNTDYTVTMDSSGIDFNGVFYNYDGTPSSFTVLRNFRINQLDGWIDKGLESLIYYCKIYDDGNLVFDLEPCINDEGVVGMVDELSNVFYAPSGKPFLNLSGRKWETITENYDRTKAIYAVKWKTSGRFEGFFSESPNVNADDATWWNYYGLDNAEMGYCTENRFDCTRKQYSNRFYGFVDEKWENQTHTVKVSDGYVFTFPKEMYWAGKITNYNYSAAANCFEVLVADVLLDVDPSEINFTYEGGTQDITINSSSDYTYNTDGSFSVVEVEGGLSVSATYNKSSNDIVGSITITNEDGLSAVVNITQSHIKEPYIQHNYKRGTIEINRQYFNGRTIKKAYYNGNMIFRSVAKTPKLILDVDTLKFDNVGGTEKITITTDANLTFSTDVDWISFEPIADGVNVTASASDLDEREATITITADNGDIQTTKTISVTQSDAIFPFPFLCNYNAKDYANRTVPKTEGQLFDEDLVFNGDLTHKGEYVKLGNSHYVEFGFPSPADNPFNRYNENGKRELTIIYKTNGFTGSSQNIFANRGGNYNYMARGNFFHTNDSDFLSFNTSASPNITYVRVAADGQAERKSISGDVSKSGMCTYGGASYGVAFFRAGYQFASEYFNADFYWIFITDKYLTDSEIQRVIDYNENKITPESTNEIWYKSGNGQAPRVGTLYDENGQSMSYTNILEGDKWVVRTERPIYSARELFYYPWYGGYLTELTLPSTLSSIPSGLVLYAQSHLTEIKGDCPLVVDNSYVFRDVEKTILGAVKTDKTLVSLQKNNNLTTIDGYGMAYMETVHTVFLPSTLTNIGDYAFEGSYELDTIVFTSYNPPTIKSRTWYAMRSRGEIIIPIDADSRWDNFQVPDGWTLVRGYTPQNQ